MISPSLVLKPNSKQKHNKDLYQILILLLYVMRIWYIFPNLSGTISGMWEQSESPRYTIFGLQVPEHETVS